MKEEETEKMELIEIQNEVEKDLVVGIVDEDYCIDLIDKGNMIAGYGLYLAKDVVHKDSNIGWEKFCKKISISTSNANRLINFYNAKSTPYGVDLPETERSFRELGKAEDEDKAKLFIKIKEVTGKENPTIQEIKIFRNLESKGSSVDEFKEELIRETVKASRSVKDAIEKTAWRAKGATPKKILEALKDGTPDDEIIEMVNGSVSKSKPKNFKVALDRNKELREENARLKKENKELMDRLGDFELFESLDSIVGQLWRVALDIEEERTVNKKIIERYSPAMKRALEVLEVEINTDMTFDKIKKAYRSKARKEHPDVGGEEKLFVRLNEAYELLKGAYNGK
jgi:hypothetical protein